MGPFLCPAMSRQTWSDSQETVEVVDLSEPCEAEKSEPEAGVPPARGLVAGRRHVEFWV